MPVLPPRLYVRAHGVFYLRIITPKALQATTGKRETWHSLRTKDPTEARILALSYALELERAKAGMGNKKGNLPAPHRKTAIKYRTKKVYAAKIKVWQEFIGKSATLDEISPQTNFELSNMAGQARPHHRTQGHIGPHHRHLYRSH